MGTYIHLIFLLHLNLTFLLLLSTPLGKLTDHHIVLCPAGWLVGWSWLVFSVDEIVKCLRDVTIHPAAAAGDADA